MSSYLPPDQVHAQLRADLEAIDAALDRIRAANTDLVGQSFPPGSTRAADREKAEHILVAHAEQHDAGFVTDS